MTRQKKTKAHDIYHETEHSFASKASFEKAFPQIEHFSIEIFETEGVEHVNFNTFDKIKHRHTNIRHIYTKESLPGEFIDCRNPECQKGGLSISGILRNIIAKKLTEFKGTETCQGYECPPKGLKEQRACSHQFHFKVKIKYMENVITGSTATSR
jgi:hypothetical protein